MNVWPFRKHNPARELALIGVEKRKRTERERFLETTRQLCAEIGKPLPEVFR